MKTLAPRQKILVFLILLTFAYFIWQLYQAYSISMTESKSSSQLLLSSTTQLQSMLTSQEANLKLLQQKIRYVDEQQVPLPTLSSQNPVGQNLVNWPNTQNSTNMTPWVKPTQQTPTIPSHVKQPTSTRHYTHLEKQLLSTPAHFYTLQLMAAQKTKTLANFIVNKRLKGKTKLLHVSHQNQDWYVLLYGIYKNYQSAKHAKQALPHSLGGLPVWIRPMESVHKAIRMRSRTESQYGDSSPAHA